MKYDILKVKITNRCNKKCGFCVFNGDETANDLPFNKYITIIGKFKKMQFTKLHINGGEPLIHPDFLRMAKYAREAFPDVKMVLGTNAILLDSPEILDFVKENFDEICIGCDVEHGNIEYVENVVPKILNKNNNLTIIINSIVEYTNSNYIERLDKLKSDFNNQIVLVQNNVYHVRRGEPINRLKELCKYNSSSNLLIQENGLCYRCFNCEVPNDNEFNIFDDNFDYKVQQIHAQHYKYCAWCPLYKVDMESEMLK